MQPPRAPPNLLEGVTAAMIVPLVSCYQRYSYLWLLHRHMHASDLAAVPGVAGRRTDAELV